MKWVGFLALAAVVLLIVVGFALGGYLDAGGSAIPGWHWFLGLPRLLRLIMEVVVVAPVALGVILYFVLQLLEFLEWLSWPLRRLAQALSDNR